MGQSSSRRGDFNLYGDPINALDEIHTRSSRKSEQKFNEYQVKIQSHIHKVIGNCPKMLKKMKKASKKGRQQIIVSRRDGLNPLREWRSSNQKKMLEGIGQNLTKEVQDIYGPDFHFHVYGFPKSLPDEYDLYLCWAPLAPNGFDHMSNRRSNRVF